MFVRGFIAGLFFMVMAIIAVGSLAKALSQTWVSATTVSKHFSDREYNEKNSGVGIELHDGDYAWLLGYYENSYNRTTVYGLRGYFPFTYGPFRLGGIAGLATGYEKPGFAAGVLTYEGRRYGANVIFTTAAIALQLKVKWN